MRRAERRVIRAGGERVEQCARIGRRAAHRVAGGGKIVEQRDHARRHIEPDRISGAPRRAGIIRHQHRDPALAARAGAQADERGDPVGDHRDAVRLGAARERSEGKSFVRRQRILEGDGAGEDAAVKLGEHDVHREIGGAEPARAVAPCRAPRGRAHDLQHRNVGGIERRRLADAAAGRERRRGDDDARAEPRKRVAQKCGRVAVLQAGDEERRRRKAAGGKRRAQRVDRRRVGGEQQGAIEDDRHDGVLELAGERSETGSTSGTCSA